MPDPQAEQEHDRRHQLAEVLVRRSHDIERRWLRQVRRELGRHDVSRADLRDSMPEYLTRLADGLREIDNPDAPGRPAWEPVAREHAETRVRLGFDIDLVVREFIILRQILFEVIEEEGMLLDIRQSGRIADLIEGAIQAAVKSYVESRDLEARRRQAEHIGFIAHELRNPLTSAMRARSSSVGRSRSGSRRSERSPSSSETCAGSASSSTACC